MNSKKNKTYIIGITCVIIVALVILWLARRPDEPPATATASGNSAPAQTAATVTHPAETFGDFDATIKAELSLRDTDFSMSMQDVQEKEDKADDLTGSANIVEDDGRTYITYRSNPDNPIQYNGFAATDTGSACVTYAFKDGKLEELRLQFGITDEATQNGIQNWINSTYGESTFYRTSDTSRTYWWKTDSNMLILHTDTGGTTLYFMKN